MINKILIPGLFFIFICFVGMSNLCAQEIHNETEVKLSDDDIAAFKVQAKSSVIDLTRYIKNIVMGGSDITEKKKQVGLAVKLFANEYKTVEVSSKNGVTRPVPIRTYLNRLMTLQYSSVTITFYDIYVSKNFIKGDDGKYYGAVTIFQVFEGTNNNELKPYRDTTEKSIQIIVEKQEYKVGVTEHERWVLKLGDIIVEETK